VHENRTLHRSEQLHARRYLSIFGEMAVPRFRLCRARRAEAEYVPLDARLVASRRELLRLEEWQQRLCVKDAFGQSVEDLKAILGRASACGRRKA